MSQVETLQTSLDHFKQRVCFTLITHVHVLLFMSYNVHVHTCTCSVCSGLIQCLFQVNSLKAQSEQFSKEKKLLKTEFLKCQKQLDSTVRIHVDVKCSCTCNEWLIDRVKSCI